MSITTIANPTAWPRAAISSARSPALRALVLSRTVVLLAGSAGALLAHRVDGWPSADQTAVSSSLGRVGNVLAATAVRWDALGYLSIAGHGYAHARITIWFPLYPLLIAALGWLIHSDVVAGILISLASFAIALTMLHRLTEFELGRRAADTTVLLLAFAPMSLFFSAIYSESLFLAVSVGAIYAARRERWAVAGILAGLAAVARVPGIVVSVPVAWLFVQRYGRLDRRLAWLALAPAALVAFLGYLAARGYGWLAPITNQTGSTNVHSLAGPLHTLSAAVQAAVNGADALIHGVSPYAPMLLGVLAPPAQSIILLAVLVLAVAALVLAARRLPAPYAVYAGLVLFVCIWSPDVRQPLESLDRYVLVIFPLWMAAGAWLSERRWWRPSVWVAVSGALLAFYSFQVTTWAFVA